MELEVGLRVYPLVNIQKYGESPFLMAKSTMNDTVQ